MQTKLQDLANRAVTLWDMPEDATARLINISENETFLIQAKGFAAVLRICRPGYQSLAALQSELDWIAALRASNTVATPAVLPGKNGKRIQVGTFGQSYNMVLFEFVDGKTPSEDDDLIPQFETLGRLAAALHLQARSWQKPPRFTRPHWGLDDVFGPRAHWGDWRAAPHVGPSELKLLERAQQRVHDALSTYGAGPERFGLIHADMRKANLLVTPSQTALIDFDDCGFGWFMYDFAAAISFIEDAPYVPDLKAAWLSGYREKANLAPEDVAALSSLIMLRRFALLAWIGSHIEAPEPQMLAPDFAARTAALAERYLSGEF